MTKIEELKRQTEALQQATEEAITERLVHAVSVIDEALVHMTNGQLGSVRGARRTIREVILARGGTCPPDPMEVPASAGSDGGGTS